LIFRAILLPFRYISTKLHRGILNLCRLIFRRSLAEKTIENSTFPTPHFALLVYMPGVTVLNIKKGAQPAVDMTADRAPRFLVYFLMIYLCVLTDSLR